MNSDKIALRHLTRYLDTQTKAISAWSKQVAKHSSGKSVHGLRLATRQARAAFWVLKHSSEHLRFKKLNRKLHRLGSALGKVREMDVALSDANHYQIKTTCLIPERMKAVKKLQKLVNKKSRKDLKRLLIKARRSVHKMSAIQVTDAREKLSLSLHRQLAEDIESPAKLHRLRIAVKKARYAIDAMGETNHPDGRSKHPMKKLQDVLGEAHDLELLQSLTGKNSKIRAKQNRLNGKAIRLSKPTLNFAVSQLEEN